MGSQARLLHETDVEVVHQPGCTVRWLVDKRLGAEHVMAYSCTVNPQRSTAHVHPGCEEVVYILEGEGRVWMEGVPHDVAPGMALHIPEDAEHGLESGIDRPLRVVGAMAPPIDVERIQTLMPHLSVTTVRSGRTVDERGVAPTLMKEGAVTPTMMGERSFRVLVNPENGCRRMTQFTGIIPPGRAPLHAHPHEEAVYVVAGTGRLWIGEKPAGALRPGSVIFFPIGVRHTLENTGSENLKVLGTFSPAGDPAAKLPVKG